MGTSSILRFFQGKSFSLATSDASYDEFCDDGPSSSIGCQSYALPECEEDQEVFAHEESSKEHDKLSQDRRNDDFCRQNGKQKGSGSILRFFSGINTRINQASNETEIQAQSLENERHQGQDNRNCQQKPAVDVHGTDERFSNQHMHGSWNFNAEEIDHSVVDELPPEIQQEVRVWLRSSKRAKTARKGSNIFHYFSAGENP